MEIPTEAARIKAALAGFITAAVALIGKTGVAIAVLSVLFVAAMLTDWISGSAAAKAKNTWESSTARAGLWHKAGEILAVLCAALADIALHAVADIYGGAALPQFPALLTPIALIWYIFTELGSIAENAAALGAPVPAWLIRGLARVKDAAHPEETEAEKEEQHE